MINTAMLVDLRNTDRFNSSVPIKLPRSFVNGSNSVEVSVIGESSRLYAVCAILFGPVRSASMLCHLLLRYWDRNPILYWLKGCTFIVHYIV